MAAYAALVSLLNNCHQIQSHPQLSTSLDNTQIQPLLEKANFLVDFIESYKYGGRNEAQDLEREITSAAYAAEDLIESHIVDWIHAAEDPVHSHVVDQIREERFSWPYLLTFLLKCVGCHLSNPSGKSSDLQRINEVMDAIMKKANGIKATIRFGEQQIPRHRAGPPTGSGETAMVGLDAELNQLLNELTGSQSSRRIISIVGMGGTGKTTLAKNVYENSLIKEQFQLRAWASISQQNNAQQVLSQLLLGKGSNRATDDLGLQLHKTLLDRRYLLVLDDIWSVEAWDEVKRFLPDKKKGSWILLTTRLSNVAKECGSSIIGMNILNEENSLKLFRQKAFQDEHCPKKLLEVEKEIAKLCKGLALSIVVVGGLLLKSPRTVGYWKEVAKDLKSISNSKEKQESLDVLSLSYNHLPPHLKPCFLYMGIFKEDSEIRVSKIINLWVAEGFIKSIGSQVLEEIAEGYVSDLIARNLIFVCNRRKNGEIGSCGIHDLSRDLCIKLAKQEEFFHVSVHGIQGMERRLVDDGDLEWTGPGLPLARSIITQGCIMWPIGYRLLRVLDEAGYNSLAHYYDNVNLRYLAYDHPDDVNTLSKLPISLSLMWNLQTLIIGNAFICLIVAPIEFWNMPQLRHVKCYQIYLPCPPRSNRKNGLLMLENLRTLKRIVNLRLCDEVCEIISNIKKLHLVYNHELMGYDDSFIENVCNLGSLLKLETLNLSIERGTWLNPDGELKKKLITSFPGSLSKLSLSCCELQWDDLTMISSCPQLEVLNLNSLSEETGEWSPIHGQFPRLKFLKINSCRLTCWNAEDSHFPILKELLLINLWRLEEIPSSIGNITALELIRVDCCSDSAAISAIRIKEDQLDYGGQLQVIVRVRETQLESFKQMLETEELTTNNIQFQIL